MKMSLLLTVAFALALVLPTAPVWAGFWPIKKEIPEVLCGEYQQVAEVRTDGEQEKAVEVSGVFFKVEPKTVVRVNGETMEVETVISVKEKGKTAHLVAFKDTSLVWILGETDTPSHLAVVQSDKKERSHSKVFVLERIDALAGKSKESTSAVCEVSDWNIERLRKTGITLSHWKHPHQDESQRLEWFRIQFSCSSLPEDQDVWVTSWVISEGKTVGAFRSVRSTKDGDNVELLFPVEEQCFDSSYVEIFIWKAVPEGGRQASGYRLSLKRIIELEPEQATDRTLRSNSPSANANPGRQLSH